LEETNSQDKKTSEQYLKAQIEETTSMQAHILEELITRKWPLS
jgi:hypothetical protein